MQPIPRCERTVPATGSSSPAEERNIHHPADKSSNWQSIVRHSFCNDGTRCHGAARCGAARRITGGSFGTAYANAAEAAAGRTSSQDWSAILFFADAVDAKGARSPRIGRLSGAVHRDFSD